MNSLTLPMTSYFTIMDVLMQFVDENVPDKDISHFDVNLSVSDNTFDISIRDTKNTFPKI